jgi:hypothetical protein
MESRAAVFTTRPQDVEVYQAGAWWPGSLLGWRHDSTGDCQVWVRVVIGGVEETAWTDLTTLRLPERSSERHLAMAPSLSATEQLKVAAGRMPVPESAAVSATRSLPPVREAAAASAPAQQSGGRRRAPEPATAEFALPEAPAAVAAPGRHRAAGVGVPGRHRASDTGMWPAVADDTGRMSVPAEAPDLVASAVSSGGGKRRADRSGAAAGQPAGQWAARPSVGDGGPSGRRALHRDAEPDLLTRPMRLDDLAGQSRKPRLDGFLSNA